MHPSPVPFASPRRARLARLLPAALALLGALLPACTPDPTGEELQSDEMFASNRFLRAIAKGEPEEPPPPDTEASDEEAGSGQRHRGEEGKMGRPTSKHKSGLYAMKGPKDGLGLVGTGRGGGGQHFLASPYGGAFAVGEGDADVWGGLAGTGLGEAIGTAGLGAGADRYAEVKNSPWLSTHAAPLSTFAIDVDTASYANVRRFLNEGGLPPEGAVRVEEMINYFDYAYADPDLAHPLGVTAEVAPCPWSPTHRLVHIGVQGKRVQATQVPPRNLVFLVDVSGSMSDEDRLPLIKQGLKLLVDDLRAEDRISLVVYAGSTGVALPPTSGREREAIRAAIDRLESGGSTDGASGIALAYRQAHQHFVKGGINRVLLATDGDFNVGVTDHDDLVRLIEKERETGVFLTVLGVGRGNLNDRTMEQVADHGNGNYAYIDSEREAHKVLVAEASGTLVTVAKDVKLQVEFNPDAVAGYRLVGYENRALTAEEFNNDKKDAGELGAGDSVTALYEIVPAGVPVPGARVDGLRYQRPVVAGDAELLTVKVRYKQPDGRKSARFEVPVSGQVERFAEASSAMRLSTAVAAFALKLRGSDQVRSLDLAAVEQWIASVDLPDPMGQREELTRLVGEARRLLARQAVHASNAAP